jgi:hypothetical protein
VVVEKESIPAMAKMVKNYSMIVVGSNPAPTTILE